MKVFSTRATQLIYITPHTIEITVECAGFIFLDFIAGQFVQFDCGGLWRSYSIVSAPDRTPFLKFCIDLVPNGVGSEFIKRTRAGDQIFMRGPLGSFILKDPSQDFCFVATGVGIAPFVSIIPELFKNGFAGRAHLIHGVRLEQDILYQNLFSELAKKYEQFSYGLCLTQPESTWQGNLGHVTEWVSQKYETFSNRTFYICGGVTMIQDTKSLLLSKQHDLSKIKLEVFV